MIGRVIKSTGSWYNIRLEEGTVIPCRIKGKLRLIERRTTNPIVIGDHVTVEKEEADYVISEVLPRRNYIIRQSAKHRTAEHILAANLDQAILMATISQPRTSTGFIDRFLVTSTAYHIPTILVFNKNDLYGEEEKNTLKSWEEIYTGAGYSTLSISAITLDHLDQLQEIIRNKVTLVAGHSGVGKSTLINDLIPGAVLRVAEISEYHEKGMHTTTFAEMLEVGAGGTTFIIDTPGIKEFGILDFAKEEVSQYFPEMASRLENCKFNNCLHLKEPKCAIKEAVEKGEIAATRYESYLSITQELEKEEPIYD